ncbi:transmembrane protein 26-like [Patiria miniata]|uniref:Transmembrane protein 26 n=1 Tax=Patiria miniata TaxID=46514 RepID=A0A913Z4C7_PATMI|nr:transmembrane protein 26-like [Patiria miniata]
MVSCGMLQPSLKAVLARCLFAIHGIITIWRVTEVNSDTVYYLLIIPVLLLPLEMIVTLKFADNGEWKWFCPSVLLYLTSVVPGLWLLQFDLYETRIDYRDSNDLEDCSGEFAYNSSGLTSDVAGLQISIPLSLAADVWAITLEQILIALLIVGRWLLPKGALTREQLSQLLLVYIGMGADILEFFGESVEEEAVVCNLPLITLIMLFWSWSLSQFTLVRTSVSAPQTKDTKRRKSMVSGGLGGCFGSEIWGLCITIVMQDGPFLVMRLYLIIAYNASSQLLLFFTIKNILVILLQLYRMAILPCASLFPGESGDHDIEGQQAEDTTDKSNEGSQAGDDDDEEKSEESNREGDQGLDNEGQQVEKTTGKSNEGFQADDDDDDGDDDDEEEQPEEVNYKGDQRPSWIGTNM